MSSPPVTLQNDELYIHYSALITVKVLKFATYNDQAQNQQYARVEFQVQSIKTKNTFPVPPITVLLVNNLPYAQVLNEAWREVVKLPAVSTDTSTGKELLAWLSFQMTMPASGESYTPFDATNAVSRV
jgi:hypothetical protein